MNPTTYKKDSDTLLFLLMEILLLIINILAYILFGLWINMFAAGFVAAVTIDVILGYLKNRT
jgi:hypothetical protein